MTDAHNWTAYGSYTVEVLERYRELETIEDRVERLKLDLETFAREEGQYDERWRMAEIGGSFSSDPAPDATIRLRFEYVTEGEAVTVWFRSTAAEFCEWLTRNG